MKEKAQKPKKKTIELKGRPSKEVLSELKTLVSRGQREWITFNYGPLAQGEILVRGGPRGQGFLPLRTSALPATALSPKDLGLYLRLSPYGLKGHLAFRLGEKYIDFRRLNFLLKRYPLALGMKGIRLVGRPRITNELKDGELLFAATNVKLSIQRVFEGSLDLAFSDQGPRVTKVFSKFDFRPVAKVEMELRPDKEGFLTGKASTEVTLGRAQGKGDFLWDRQGLSAQGRLSYQDEKFDGSIGLQVVSANKAKERLADKVPKWRPLKRPYALFAEGDLTFHFTDWLSGKARVVIDPWGHFTVCGEITPQAEIELFPQKDYRKELPSLEARASYGLPVLGNVFLFVGIGLELWAVLGPAKFYNIKVSGQYSTDPAVAKDFRVEGSLNISAAAGLDARIEGGAGLEIVDHDLKAGIGLTGRAGIKGYAEATPIVGYRENPDTGKGEFFIHGELELGAQPFLGLTGDFFIEVDSPWWSPLGDKEWRWPFLNKEWPLPGQLALKAEVDYVFGSKEWPKIEFGQVDFDPAKFASDLVHRRVKSGPGKREAKGRWKEKNSGREKIPKKKKAGQAAKAKKGGRASRPRKRRLRAPRPRVRGPRKLRSLRQRAFKRRGQKRKKKKLVPKAPRKVREKRLDPRQRRAIEEVRAAFLREKKPLPRYRVRSLVRKLKRKHKFKRLKVRFRRKRYEIIAGFSPEITVFSGETKTRIALFSSEPRCESEYEIRDQKLIFRTFFLPRAKYFSTIKGKPYYQPFFKKRTIRVDLTRVGERKENAQRESWKKELGEEARENIRKFLIEKELAAKIPLEELLKCDWHVFPAWGRNCQPTSFDVDHIVELSVGGEDEVKKNYVLFGSRANRSSGGAFAAYFRAMRTKFQEIKREDPELQGVILYKRANEKVHLGRGKVKQGPIWTKEEVTQGEHIKKCVRSLTKKLESSK